MGQAGILCPDDRVELIDGEVVAKGVIGPRHGATVDRANRVFMTTAGASAIVRVQGAVRLDPYNEPEPDLALLRPRADYYASVQPGPRDILLLVEVAESSLAYDRDVKAPMYARSGVREYWLVDLNDRVLLRFSAPEGGLYSNLQKDGPGRRVTPHLLPSCIVSTDDLL